MSVTEGEVLWTPSDEVKAASHLTHFTNWLAAEQDLKFEDYRALHDWSVEHLSDFWQSVWRYFDIRSDAPYQCVIGEHVMPGAEWFEGARVNYAEHVLRAGEGQGATAAILSMSEVRPIVRMSWDELAGRVRRLATSLRGLGVQPGDRVAAYLPNTPEAVVALLATVAIGGVWSSAAPEFGVAAVIDRFAQIEPKLLFAADGYRFNGRNFDRRSAVKEIVGALPSLAKVVTFAYLDPLADFDGSGPAHHDLHQLCHQGAPIAPEDFEFARVPHDHPLWICFRLAPRACRRRSSTAMWACL
jgi:acetoacetyl-CoA synthetase